MKKYLLSALIVFVCCLDSHACLRFLPCRPAPMPCEIICPQPIFVMPLCPPPVVIVPCPEFILPLPTEVIEETGGGGKGIQLYDLITGHDTSFLSGGGLVGVNSSSGAFAAAFGGGGGGGGGSGGGGGGNGGGTPGTPVFPPFPPFSPYPPIFIDNSNFNSIVNNNTNIINNNTTIINIYGSDCCCDCDCKSDKPGPGPGPNPVPAPGGFLLLLSAAPLAGWRYRQEIVKTLWR